MQADQTLFNRSFLTLCLCNFAFCISFHMLIPTLPIYFTQDLHVSRTVAGAVISLYSVAALLTRPISGFVVDCFQRKPVFLIFMSAFVLCTFCYYWFTNLYLLILLRFIHGAAFGSAQTSISTMSVDAIPPGRLGTGIGLFGMLNTISMACGPLIGLMIAQRFSVKMVFVASPAFIAFLLGLSVKAKTHEIKQRMNKGRIRLDNLIFKDVLGMAFCLMLACIAFGFLSNYISLFAIERDMAIYAAYFFVMLSGGMVISRFISSPFLDKGYVASIILPGKAMILVAFIIFLNMSSASQFLCSALLFGLGYGFLFPAYHTDFVARAHENQKGTANSTFFLAGDIGTGVAILLGGALSDLLGMYGMYCLGMGLVVASIILFAMLHRAKKA